MKKADISGIVFLAVFVLIVIFFPINYGFGGTSGLLEKGSMHLYWSGFSCKNGFDNFGNVTKQFPYIMGFIKFALLATFGEMLKNRLKSGSWKLDLFLPRAAVWGFFGIIMAIAFQIFAGGVAAMIDSGNWFGSLLDKSFSNKLVFALSTSLWMNMIFAYPMMLAHEWCNSCLTHRKLLGGGAFFSELPAQVWGSFIPKTILFFWIPAHTVTFLLPPDFRVLMGAALSVALGFILTLHAMHKKG